VDLFATRARLPRTPYRLNTTRWEEENWVLCIETRKRDPGDVLLFGKRCRIGAAEAAGAAVADVAAGWVPLVVRCTSVGHTYTQGVFNTGRIDFDFFLFFFVRAQSKLQSRRGIL